MNTSSYFYEWVNPSYKNESHRQKARVNEFFQNSPVVVLGVILHRKIE